MPKPNQIEAANNRIKQLQPDGDQITDYEFDAAGNTIKDPSNRRFKYDGENKQINVAQLDSNGNETSVIGKYFYDGDGKRVKKLVPSTGETTIFHYDAGGKLIAEYSTVVETESPQVSYLTNDHLGSPRVTTDQFGNVSSRRDFLPFGEEITSLHAQQRTGGVGYKADTVRQKFTGYERDKETALDFAQARMHHPSLGRFLSVDPSRVSIDFANPQSWDRYSYVLNNPYSFVDKNGKWPTKTHNAMIQQAFSGLSKQEIEKIQKGSERIDKATDKEFGIRTMNPENANEHAMSKLGQTLEDAKSGMFNFYISKFVDAIEVQLSSEENKQGGLNYGALFIFGEGSHALEDYSSPAHGPFNVYTIAGKAPKSLDELSAKEKVIGALEAAKHVYDESGTPTQEQIAGSILLMRASFLITFGKAAFERAVPNEDDRKAVYEQFDSDEDFRQ